MTTTTTDLGTTIDPPVVMPLAEQRSDAPPVPHPVWCHTADLNRTADCNRCESDDRVLPDGSHNVMGTHRGQLLTLDCGESFAYTVTVQPWQMFEDEHRFPAGLELVVTQNELIDADASAFLTIAEARRLVAMLQEALSRVDLEHPRT